MLISSYADDHGSDGDTVGVLGILPVTDIPCCDHRLIVLELENDFSNKTNSLDSCHDDVMAFSSIDPTAGSVSACHLAVHH